MIAISNPGLRDEDSVPDFTADFQCGSFSPVRRRDGAPPKTAPLESFMGRTAADAVPVEPLIPLREIQPETRDCGIKDSR